MVWVVSLSDVKLIPHALTPVHHVNGIRSLVGFGNLVGPLVHPVLYLRDTNTRLALKLFRGEPAITGFDYCMLLSALFRLAFATASPLNGLTLQHTSNSLAHYAKGTPSPR